MDKVKNFYDHSMILWEMAGNLLTNAMGRILPHPPMSFKVKTMGLETWEIEYQLWIRKQDLQTEIFKQAFFQFQFKTSCLV